jgi:aminomethyltransferase
MEKKGELKKTPLCDWHRANGGKMVDFGGWEMPVQYEPGIVQEHLATRRHGGLFDVSHMGRFRFRGADLIPFLQKVMTNNCQALEPWTSQYSIIQNENGGALDDAFLYRFDEDDYLMVVNASNLEKDWAHFQEQAKAFGDLTLEDHSEKLAMIAFQGPLAKEILENLHQGGFMPEPRQNNLSKTSIKGTEILLSRTGYTGEPNSFELFVPAGKAVEIWEALYNEGRDAGVVPVGLGARDTLRLEASMPLYGHELGEDLEGNEIPIFAIALAPVAVSLSPLKGEFIGREPLSRQLKALKEIRDGAAAPPPDLPRRIMPLALIDRGIARQGHEVLLNGKKIGYVSSGTSCPYWKLEGEGAMMQPGGDSALRSLALAYLDSTTLPETEVEIAVRKKRIKAQVVKFHGRSDAPPYFHALPVGGKE